MIEELKTRQLLESDAANLITNSFSGVKLAVMQNELNNANRVAKGCRYSDEVKQFALTLHYYSPRAYEYCRSILRLPHASSLRNWLLSVDSQPGFLQTVLDMVSKQDERDLSLVLHSMVIRKRSHFNTHQGVFEGFCNYGGIVGEESDTGH